MEQHTIKLTTHRNNATCSTSTLTHLLYVPEPWRTELSSIGLASQSTDPLWKCFETVSVLCSRYCGELSSLAVTSKTNKLEVKFHSDEAFTDKGFRAEYTAFDPANRELKKT